MNGGTLINTNNKYCCLKHFAVNLKTKFKRPLKLNINLMKKRQKSNGKMTHMSQKIIILQCTLVQEYTKLYKNGAAIAPLFNLSNYYFSFKKSKNCVLDEKSIISQLNVIKLRFI